MEKLKQYAGLAVGLVMAILTGAFLFERSRRKSAEAVADNKEVLDKINEGDKQITRNDGNLQAEEDKRAEIQKEVENDKRDDSDDPANFLKRR